MPSKQKNTTPSASSPPKKRNQPVVKPDSLQSMPGLEEPEQIEFNPYFDGHVVRCGAKNKRTQRACRSLAMDNGRCRLHGGKSPGPPEGNKNGVTHGAFERLFYKSLTNEEIEFMEQKISIKANLDLTIQLLTIREARMMERIELLRESGDFTTVEITNESGEKNKKTRKKVGTLSQIQSIEDALTKVQEKKARLLELKHKIDNADNKDAVPNFDKFYEALEKTAKDVWGDEKDGE